MKVIPHTGAGPRLWTRRHFLTRNAMGIGSVALAWLLREEKLLATLPNMPRGPQSFDLKPKAPLFPPRARAMISLFMHGGPSHIDLFDPKPELTRRSGQDYTGGAACQSVPWAACPCCSRERSCAGPSRPF